jgi:hypothetical protein
MGIWRDEGLASLDWHWGDVYEVTEALGVWRAVRRDTCRALVEISAEDLRDQIRKDYTDHPVPAEFRGRVIQNPFAGRTPLG